MRRSSKEKKNILSRSKENVNTDPETNTMTPTFKT